jgi:hypothetical protein
MKDYPPGRNFSVVPGAWEVKQIRKLTARFGWCLRIAQATVRYGQRGRGAHGKVAFV